MIINKILFENPIFVVFYQYFLAAIIYINKNFAKRNQGFEI